jgi:hypothetical protein
MYRCVVARSRCPASSWIARAGAPRIARCEQNVWRRTWTPGSTRSRRATRATMPCTTFWVSGRRSGSVSLRGQSKVAVACPLLKSAFRAAVITGVPGCSLARSPAGRVSRTYPTLRINRRRSHD